MARFSPSPQPSYLAPSVPRVGTDASVTRMPPEGSAPAHRGEALMAPPYGECLVRRARGPALGHPSHEDVPMVLPGADGPAPPPEADLAGRADTPPRCTVPHFAPVRVRGGCHGLRRLARHRRRAVAMGLAVTAASLVAAGPGGSGDARAHPDAVALPRAAPGPAPEQGAVGTVTAPVRIADGASVRLLRPGAKVDVIAADGERPARRCGGRGTCHAGAGGRSHRERRAGRAVRTAHHGRPSGRCRRRLTADGDAVLIRPPDPVPRSRIPVHPAWTGQARDTLP